MEKTKLQIFEESLSEAVIKFHREAMLHQKKVMIEKACKWMKEQVYQEYGGGPLERLIPNTRIEEFRKAMEE